MIPILVAVGVGTLAISGGVLVWRGRRETARRSERKARHQRRRAHQYAWDIVMRRNGARRLTDQRERID